MDRPTHELEHSHGPSSALGSNTSGTFFDMDVESFIRLKGRCLEPTPDVSGVDDGDLGRGRERRDAVSERERSDARTEDREGRWQGRHGGGLVRVLERTRAEDRWTKAE